MANAPVPKPLRFEYQSFNNRPGLTDVKGQVYVSGVPKAVGTNALSFAELDSTNAKGQYTLVISTAQLTTWGVAAGQENSVVVWANSATWPGPVPLKAVAQFATADDVIAYLGTPAGATIAADIKSVSDKLGTPVGSSVSVDIAGLNTQGAQILTQLQALANAATIGGGAAFVLPAHIQSPTAPTTIVIPIPVLDNDGDLVDPSGGIVVGLKNAAGQDRGSYLQGSAGSPATVQATKNSTGLYQVVTVLPAGAPLEQLIYSFSYPILGKPQIRLGVAQVTSDNSTQAQQSTLQAVQTTVNAINTAIQSSQFGLNALYGILTNSTYGLSALNALLTDSGVGLAAIKALLSNSTYGLAQLGTLIGQVNTSLTALTAQLTSTQGTGFDSAKNSLVAISNAIALIPISGARGV